MPIRGKVKTVLKELGLDVEWRIDLFYALSYDQLYSSPQFSFNAHTWSLGIWTDDSCYKFYLDRSSHGPTISQDFSIAIKVLNGLKKFETHCTHDFPVEVPYSVPHSTLSRYDVLSRYKEFVTSGGLTVVCTMKMPTSARYAYYCNRTTAYSIPVQLISRSPPLSPNNAAQLISCSTSSSSSNIAAETQRKRKAVTESIPEREQPEKLSKTTEKGGSGKLLNDLKEMMLSGDHSDITIRVKGEDIKLHRNILSARNSYFRSMFKTDMLEKTTGIVSIEDCEPHVFRSFIHFIYTGKVDNQSLENVCDLYEIADKYQEDELKADCLHCMMDNINVDNFCDFTALALKYEEKKLLETATNFFCIKVKEIIRCEKWQAFLKEYSTQANELYIKAIDNFDDDDDDVMPYIEPITYD